MGEMTWEQRIQKVTSKLKRMAESGYWTEKTPPGFAEALMEGTCTSENGFIFEDDITTVMVTIRKGDAEMPITHEAINDLDNNRGMKCH